MNFMVGSGQSDVDAASEDYHLIQSTVLSGFAYIINLCVFELIDDG